MKIKLGNNKGASLVLVLIVIAVLAVMADILMEASFQGYRTSKASGYMDYSYYAAESAVQKCCDLLYSKCGNADLAASGNVSYTGDDEAFSKDIVNKVLVPYVDTLNVDGQFIGMDVSNGSTGTADVNMKIQYMGCRKDPSGNTGILLVKIGISADSSYVVRPYTSGDKNVFAVKEFPVYLPDGFKLKGPVYSIGDLMADNSTVNILGDVHVYGTSPEKLSQPQQYYYGGIYAKNNSELRINGNAYSRSFIRTGKYIPNEDNSSILVSKDAVAQGMQIFGKNDRIVVMRNAYTFDDLEINGENSVIAVNGSYFGLSDGSEGSYHDNSSAIVNSAAIHYANSAESQRSRIVINGAVMVNGGTFRLDPLSGDALYQIEDASVAWIDDILGMGPLYKRCPPVQGTDYKNWLIINGYDSTAKGFGNLFQVWNSIPWNSSQGDIDAWLARIDAARLTGSNDTSKFDIQAGNSIAGFCNFCMAANDRMYMMKKDDQSNSGIGKAVSLRDTYEVENIEPQSVGAAEWESFWNPYLDDSIWNGGYCTKIPIALNDVLKPQFLNLADIFIKRVTYDSNNGNINGIIEHHMGQVFTNLTDSLEALRDNMPGNKYIITPYNTTDGGNLSSASYPFNEAWAVDKYFLVINDNPDRDLVLDGTTFNGIIFTTGRVILKNGAVVNGAIVAAGRGYDGSAPGYVSGSAAECKEISGTNTAFRAPRVEEDGANLYVLDNGGYAAVCCEGDVEINFPCAGSTMSQDEGRKDLLDRFKYQDIDYSIDLYNIF